MSYAVEPGVIAALLSARHPAVWLLWVAPDVIVVATAKLLPHIIAQQLSAVVVTVVVLGVLPLLDTEPSTVVVCEAPLYDAV